MFWRMASSGVVADARRVVEKGSAEPLCSTVRCEPDAGWISQFSHVVFQSMLETRYAVTQSVLSSKSFEPFFAWREVM